MDWTGGRQFAAIKMNRVDPKHSGIDLCIRFEKSAEHAAGNIATARESNMRMPRSQIGRESHRKCCVLDTFVKLKKMRMTSTDADPNNLDHAFERKCSDSFNRQEESAKFNGLEFCAQGKIHFLPNVRKETEREMQLIPNRPVDAANAGIKIDQNFSN